MPHTRKQPDNRRSLRKQIELFRDRAQKDLFNQFLANHVNAIKGINNVIIKKAIR